MAFGNWLLVIGCQIRSSVASLSDHGCDPQFVDSRPALQTVRVVTLALDHFKPETFPVPPPFDNSITVLPSPILLRITPLEAVVNTLKDSNAFKKWNAVRRISGTTSLPVSLTGNP